MPNTIKTSAGIPWCLRQSPFMLWGVGTLGKNLAKTIVDGVMTKTQASALCHYYEGNAESLNEFQQALATLIQSAQKQGFFEELEVKLILPAWELNQSFDTALVKLVSQTLQSLVSGNQSLTLSLLIPPITASDESKLKSFQCLSDLEPFFGCVPFLNIAFVHQVPPEVYENPGMDNEAFQDLLTLLQRESLDDGLSSTIREIGWSLIGNQQPVNGHSCCFSAIGAQTILYSPLELFEHLYSRFQYDLFNQGLNNPENISESQSRLLKEQAESLLCQCQAELIRCLPELNKIAEKAVREFEQSHLDLTHKQQIVTELNDTNSHIKQDIQGALKSIVDGCEQLIHTELDKVLALNPAYLAGAVFFLQAIKNDGANLESEDKSIKPFDLISLESEFYWQPFIESVQNYFGPLIQTLATELGITLSESDDSNDIFARVKKVAVDLDKLENYLSEKQTQSDNLKFGWALKVWPIFETFIANQTSEPDFATDLLRKVVTVFCEVTNTLADARQVLQKQCQTLEVEIEKEYQACPWYVWPFFFVSEYRKNIANKQEEITHLKEDGNSVEVHFSSMLTVYTDIANQLLWPQFIRSILIDSLQKKLIETDSELQTYIGQVSQTCLNHWRLREAVSQNTSLTKTTLLDQDKLDRLYCDRVDSTLWIEWVNKLFQHKPSAGMAASDQSLRYGDCKNLCDHFHANPDTLNNRLDDFSREIFASTKKLNVMDVIQLDVPEQSDTFLSRIFAKTEYQPELSPGLIPIVQQHGMLQCIHVIRCSESIKKKINEDYSFLLSENDIFHVIDDESILDITTFRFGFPLTLLHVLNSQTFQKLDTPVINKL